MKNASVKITKVYRGYIIQSFKEEYRDNDPVGPGDYYPESNTRVYETFGDAVGYLYSHFEEAESVKEIVSCTCKKTNANCELHR